MDVFSKKKRSWIMSRIRNSGTKPEKQILHTISQFFYPRGYRYRKNYAELPGKPDIAFTKQKVAIFVDGDFWHGYKSKNWLNKLPRKYWQNKIRSNIQRDAENNKKLKSLGWKVIRFWEHETESSQATISKVHKVLKPRR